jgi:hypothetical protein
MKSIIVVLLLSLVSHLTPSSHNGYQTVEIYSGNCTLYHREWAGDNKVRYKNLGQAFAKLVINRSSKHLNFFYNGKLVFSRNSFDSYIDDKQGGEGFTSNNGVDAHRFTAERLFQINVTDPFNSSDLGYQYEISDYRVN